MATKYDSFLLNSSSSITVGTTPVTGSDLQLTANGEPDVTLSGIVSYGTTPTPISYAKVTLDGSTSDAVTVYTDINGYYSIAIDSAQTYSIAVSKTGFATNTATGLTFTAGTAATRNVTLTALDTTGNMIFGTVVDTATTPAAIDNALVTIANAANEVVQFTQTDANGEYAAYGLGNATYTVIISKSGYGAEVATVTLSATVTIAENNAALKASPATGTGSISGTITDTQATPAAIASAWVGLYKVLSGNEELTQATLTGSAGDYIFTGLDAGSYMIKSKKTTEIV
jgi:hypothetical protein